jgi:hypothetical protein
LIIFPNVLASNLLFAAYSGICPSHVIVLFIPAILPPGNGSGVYFGRSFARPPSLFPISSNGLTAASTALLTHFAAINAAQIKTRAIISIIIVHREFPAASSAPNISISFLLFDAGHSKVQLIPHIVTVVWVAFIVCPSASFPLSTFLASIWFSGIPNKTIHFVPLSDVPEHLSHCIHFCPVIKAETMTRPNESVIPTTAGTNARPINSLRLKSFIFSPRISLPRTKWSVKRGENIAYIQSLIARTRSIKISAITRIPKTKNMSTPIIPR